MHLYVFITWRAGTLFCTSSSSHCLKSSMAASFVLFYAESLAFAVLSGIYHVLKKGFRKSGSWPPIGTLLYSKNSHFIRQCIHTLHYVVMDFDLPCCVGWWNDIKHIRRAPCSFVGNKVTLPGCKLNKLNLCCPTLQREFVEIFPNKNEKSLPKIMKNHSMSWMLSSIFVVTFSGGIWK